MAGVNPSTLTRSLNHSPHFVATSDTLIAAIFSSNLCTRVASVFLWAITKSAYNLWCFIKFLPLSSLSSSSPGKADLALLNIHDKVQVSCPELDAFEIVRMIVWACLRSIATGKFRGNFNFRFFLTLSELTSWLVHGNSQQRSWTSHHAFHSLADLPAAQKVVASLNVGVPDSQILKS